jgi:hypothetical protein
MPSRRGRYAHGRDKDEWFLRRYNGGWQAWWLLVILVLAMIVAAAGSGLGVALGTHHTNGADTRRAYMQGYIDGQDSVSTTTTRPEPSPLSPGSGAPAPDPTTGPPATPVSPTAVPLTG